MSNCSAADTRFRQPASFNGPAALQKIKCKSCGCWKKRGGTSCTVCGTKGVPVSQILNFKQYDARKQVSTNNSCPTSTSTSRSSSAARNGHQQQNNSLAFDMMEQLNDRHHHHHQHQHHHGVASSATRRANNVPGGAVCRYRTDELYDVYQDHHHASGATRGSGGVHEPAPVVFHPKVKCSSCGCWTKRNFFCPFCRVEAPRN